MIQIVRWSMVDVIGAIRAKWLVFGGESGMGLPLSVELPTFDGQGRAQSFRGGQRLPAATISWHPDIGEAFAVWGLIQEKWNAVGREQYGYPVTDELPCPDGRGRFNHFRSMQLAGRPEASVYWTPETDAHEVHGAIRAAWKDMGWERSSLGYPTSDEYDPGKPGWRRSDFEHGRMDWSAEGGARLHTPFHPAIKLAKAPHSFDVLGTGFTPNGDVVFVYSYIRPSGESVASDHNAPPRTHTNMDGEFALTIAVAFQNPVTIFVDAVDVITKHSTSARVG
jgi:uncharacterized protein with LGFP repeats